MTTFGPVLGAATEGAANVDAGAVVVVAWDWTEVVVVAGGPGATSVDEVDPVDRVVEDVVA